MTAKPSLEVLLAQQEEFRRRGLRTTGDVLALIRALEAAPAKPSESRAALLSGLGRAAKTIVTLETQRDRLYYLLGALEAENARWKGQAIELMARVSNVQRREKARAIENLWGQIDVLRIRAEKAEARVKELEAAVEAAVATYKEE